MSVTSPAAQAGAPPGYSGHKANHLARPARIEGQAHGVARIASGDPLLHRRADPGQLHHLDAASGRAWPRQQDPVRR
jgi:hypothetical protein